MTSDPQRMLPQGYLAPPAPARERHEVLWGIIGFILGIVAASLWFMETHFEEMRDLPATSPVAPQEDAANGVISVEDQSAGNSVVVDSVHVTVPVWVAVAEMREDTVMNILGAVPIPGPTDGVHVPLLRSTLPGGTYAIVLYRDDGDGQFDLHKDSVYIDWDSGERVVAPFMTNP